MLWIDQSIINQWYACHQTLFQLVSLSSADWLFALFRIVFFDLSGSRLKRANYLAYTAISAFITIVIPMSTGSKSRVNKHLFLIEKEKQNGGRGHSWMIEWGRERVWIEHTHTHTHKKTINSRPYAHPKPIWAIASSLNTYTFHFHWNCAFQAFQRCLLWNSSDSLLFRLIGRKNWMACYGESLQLRQQSIVNFWISSISFFFWITPITTAWSTSIARRNTHTYTLKMPFNRSTNR